MHKVSKTRLGLERLGLGLRPATKGLVLVSVSRKFWKVSVSIAVGLKIRSFGLVSVSGRSISFRPIPATLAQVLYSSSKWASLKRF